MKPVPAEIAKRWAPLWGHERHPTRPWWRLESASSRSAAGTFVTWKRCDGLFVGARCDMDFTTWGSPEQHGKEVMRRAVDAAGTLLAAHDVTDLLAAPPPMPGQVWAWPDYGPQEVLVTSVCRDIVFANGQEVVWPLNDAILVAGPTPWGRDIPWSPA